MKTLEEALRWSMISTALVCLIVGCTVGRVQDTSGSPISGADIVAYGQCAGDGCEANKVATEAPSGTLTGYHASTNANGLFFFDPYAEQVPPSEAMAIVVPEGSSDNYYKMQISQVGFQDVWRDYTPKFEQHVHDGSTYLISQVPDTFLCRFDEVDTDGDGICDAAETLYGMSSVAADTDSDGTYDDQELYGTGSPFKINTRKLIRYSINVSDIESSKAFYERLGFQSSVESTLDISDPDQAQALNLAPYQVESAIMVLDDGFVVELNQFITLYDSEPVNTGVALGMTGLTLDTENLVADMASLDAVGVSYDVVSELYGDPLAITLTDPDGIGVMLIQRAGPTNTSADYAHGIAGPTIYVSDYQSSLEFYQNLGFRLKERANQPDTLSLGNLREVTLVETSSSSGPYEEANHLGISRLAIETTNLDQDIQILQEQGVSFYSSPVTQPVPFEELRSVAFEDPDGTIIELVQYSWADRPARLGDGSGAGRESLPLGEMCDGTPESFYGERLFEPVLCGDTGLPVPVPRLEAAPRHQALYASERCGTPLIFQTAEQRFDCATVEFFLGLQDGRKSEREHSMRYISKAIQLAEGDASTMTDEYKYNLARMYEYRAIGKNGMGLENGVFEYLVYPELHAGADFARTEELNPGNIPAIAFGLSNDLTSARIAGDEELAVAKAWEILEFAETAGNPNTLEAINVGVILTLMGIVADFPMNTGLPQRMLEDFLWAMSFDGDLDYFTVNTKKAPFIRPGLEYALASLYARNGLRDEYIAQLEVVAAQPRYEEWAWYDFVEAQRANPNRMLAKFESFGGDGYSDTYAGSNNGCMVCHGNQ
ncbi:Glyoxalase-like domain protein [Microbulbifer aggregans]|uniref:Glyoxalase-like domain protein n=1 Tax=Microbulbifer aggregans TaxID=1769779 RepID=A0A1C9W8Y2_9GAMM|nr:VOC family protein [Microbulbifer aggregans]AOS97603.1 Glyoxalase-like domain protein [Microbulbifer aggregans]